MNDFVETGRLFLGLYEREFTALILTLPRVYLFVYVSQIMGLQAVPRLVCNAMVLVLTAFAAPINLAHIDGFDGSVLTYASHFFKEAVIGLLMGYVFGWIFWAVQSAGALIDNQRGAAIASSIDPLHAQETTPLGLLFSQAFLTYTFLSGAILNLLFVLFQSFVLWPAGQLIPRPTEHLPAVLLSMADRGTETIVIYALPVVALMFLTEFALALVSRFTPQVQVFILSMPIKSALAMFILIVYFSRLLDAANFDLMLVRNGLEELISALRGIPDGNP